MHITLRQLEVFAEVLKSGSTTQASVMLALSQSAVSAALTDLEGQLGVQLFDRVGKRLVVNEHGRLLYPRALALLEQTTEIEQLFRKDNGAIRVYASSTIGNYILPAMIARYRQDFPDLPLELSVGNSQDVINAVLDFRVDIGLIEGPCHSTEIISEPWLEDELVVFAAPSSPLTKGPITLEQLAASPWILRERGSGTRELVDYLLLSHLPRFQMAMELGNSEAIKHAVRHGLGISCLSRRVIAEQLQAGTLSEVTVPLPRLVRTLWRVHHRQKHISNAITRFLYYSDQVE
ncbi:MULTISPECIES: DNA-binding transcriptional regulator YeiE [Citrobacter]|jgi:DNA-binding transcriptional LysR family regulator|uniref:LysR family transcriptional regulator n=1 Tax=Citrobacter braakii TaxID=57706 RepID=A0A8I0KJK3_CITBR|nr:MULTISPECIES: DNA-binding transcriptional regulator YeiE [Citrobacter]MBA7795344.1 LysR family transcriptional regulator [Citrobacter sp. RHBSTW-01065]MCI1670180.1 LysR family transcriptional regulator [Citrobacter freundii]EHG7889419.1 LysR family transcriptional regulator [Citrobacter braakii]ELK7433828.1 LysR family transcriptional regulator [Citrobacter braakii]ELN2655876.1 LysR family transcriptional regulator [Citrobacter braakii]